MDQRKVLFQWYVCHHSLKEPVMTLVSASLHQLFVCEQSDSVTCLVNTVGGDVFNVLVLLHMNTVSSVATDMTPVG